MPSSYYTIAVILRSVLVQVNMIRNVWFHFFLMDALQAVWEVAREAAVLDHLMGKEGLVFIK